MSITAMKTLAFAILAPGSVTLLFPALVLRASNEWGRIDLGLLHWAGALLILPGIAILAWTFADFVRHGRGTPSPSDPPKRLVTKGLYRHVRNPMYVGVISILLGECLYTGALPLAIFTACMWIAFHTFIKLYEEPALERAFGENYRTYKAAVPRWIPRVTARD